MGFFSNILQKLGLSKDKPATPAAAPVASTVKPMTSAPVAPSKPSVSKGNYEPVSSAPAKPTMPAAPIAVAEVDVVKHLEELSKGKDLNWKVSIVDLLKLLDIDSSHEARNELAKELNCPANLMSDSAKMNVWLHKEVLRKIAENGGNIPQSMLD